MFSHGGEVWVIIRGCCDELGAWYSRGLSRVRVTSLDGLMPPHLQALS
jgi:hypothetical protein